MITGKKLLSLSPEVILSFVTEYDIYRFYCTRPFTLNKPFNSPMPGRGDSVASFLIGNKNGFLYHIDFGDSRFRGNCFDFVKQLLMLPDFHQTLKKIDKDFGLGISDGKVTDVRTQIITYQQPKMEEKRPAYIQVKVRKNFNKAELKYWEGYYQDENDLRDEFIYPLKEVLIDKVQYGWKKDELIFGYLFEDKYWKIYRPFAENPKLKWKNNAPIDTVDGLENVRGCKNAIVTKSKKDKMVLRKIFPCVCAVQNESLVALNQNTISYLNEQCENVYINYDADAPGKKNSRIVTETLGYKHVNVPDIFLKEGIKDFADLARIHGLDIVKNHLNEKNII